MLALEWLLTDWLTVSIPLVGFCAVSVSLVGCYAVSIGRLLSSQPTPL